jgi:ribulose-5-phosphate 4-epimerase/fuculose-1-phosphate aldolase
LVNDRGDAQYNEAGHLIHSAVLKARPDANFVLHTHTRAGAAVSAMKCGLLPISQHANIIRDAIAYHEYQQVTSSEDECERLGHDLADKNIMMMHNHGLMTCGRTAGEAFWFMYYMEVSCKIQIDVLAAGTEYIVPEDSAVEDLRKIGIPKDDMIRGDREWPGLLRMLDRLDPGFRQ